MNNRLLVSCVRLTRVYVLNGLRFCIDSYPNGGVLGLLLLKGAWMFLIEGTSPSPLIFVCLINRSPVVDWTLLWCRLKLELGVF